jgi:hypothetical protein
MRDRLQFLVFSHQEIAKFYSEAFFQITIENTKVARGSKCGGAITPKE